MPAWRGEGGRRQGDRRGGGVSEGGGCRLSFLGGCLCAACFRSGHTANLRCVPQIWGARQTSPFVMCSCFAVCFLPRHTANVVFTACYVFTVRSWFDNTAKNKFAACPKICTRQKFGHTANRPFPVVMSRYRGLNNRLYIQCPDR